MERKDHPILFSGEMVRAILKGRKTQTRRIVKPQPDEDGICLDLERNQYLDTSDRVYRRPYGMPGDRLWVRETWGPGYFYKADDETIQPSDGWRPSIHMPRRASRLTLGVIGIRVERLQDISEQDAIAEGAEPYDVSTLSDDELYLLDAPLLDRSTPYKNGFALLWDSINRNRASWDSNPWVWVVEFDPIEKNIDEVN